MSRRSLTALLLSVSSLLATTVGLGVNAVLADCGGAPCSCGDTVDVDTTLDPLVDPVCSTGPADTCPAVGLFVNAGISLNLGNCTLRGAADSIFGVTGKAGAQVRGGRISGFGELGVELVGDGGTVSNVQVRDVGGFGIEVIGNTSRVEKSIVRNSGGGVAVFGDDNIVSAVQALDNRRRGVSIVGGGNTVEKTNAFRNGEEGIILFGNDNAARSNNAQGNRHGVAALDTIGNDNVVIANNTVLGNTLCGIVIAGTSAHATVTQNQTRYNGTGLCLEGSDHSVSLNVVSASAGDGISVSATGSAFERNSSNSNGSANDPRFGIVDVTTGGGTGGTANTYIRNICRANLAGASDPAGLCK